MSLDLSPLSSSLPQPRDLPWETLIHIFSYCDQPTLAAVSLVSFACWELAGPILYQDVEIVDLDGLASLFFIEITPSSLRLQQATSLLSRIRTLSIYLCTWIQESGPRFRGPSYNERTGNDYDSVELLPPHRLNAATTVPLPLQTLSIPADVDEHFLFFGWLGLQLFPHLNPTQVVHRNPRRPAFPTWPICCQSAPREFLVVWTNLQRVIWDGYEILALPRASSGVAFREDGLYALWVPPEGEEKKRSLELVFETDKDGDWERITSGRHSTLDRLLYKGGVDEQLVGRVDLRVLLKVRQEDQKVARDDVGKLSAWMRKLVRVEVV